MEPKFFFYRVYSMRIPYFLEEKKTLISYYLKVVLSEIQLIIDMSLIILVSRWLKLNGMKINKSLKILNLSYITI